jgi:ATP-dependent helicase/DNAse subunit B
MTTDINRITPSMLKKYEECPLSFFYNYVLGLQLDQQMMHLNFGTSIHLAIDNIYEQCDDKTLWEFAEFSIVKNIFLKDFIEDKVTAEGFATDEERLEKWKEMRDNGVSLLQAFWDEKERLYVAGIKPKEFEVMMKFQPFNPETKELLDVPLSLRIDALNRETKSIIELKTSASKYDVVDTRMLPQTLAYVWAMYCKTGKVYSVDYVVMLKNHKKDRIQHLHYDYDIADILAFDARVRNILQKIKNREYNLNQTCKVGYCDCKKYKELLNVSEY